MARKRRKLPLLEQVEIIDIGAEGKSIARVNDQIVFVNKTVPGDIVDVQVTRMRRRFMEGNPVVFRQYSKHRIEPFCEHFGTCGGCKWQHLPYDKQLFFKQKQVVDQMQRIGGFGGEIIEQILPILGSEQTDHYRNKLEFTFSNKRWLSKEEMESDMEFEDRNALGFHIPGLFDKILEINNCYLQPEPSNSIRNWCRKYTQEHKFSYFDIRNHAGMMRNLIIRTTSTGETMVIVSFYEKPGLKGKKLLKEMARAFSEITSLMYVVNQKPNDTILDQEIILFSGKNFIVEQMEGLKFKIGPKSFFQTNSSQAYHLYKIVREFTELDGTQRIWDLYTGTGTIANFLAGKATHVLGIETVPEAILDAKENAELNGIANSDFIVSDIKDLDVDELIIDYGTPDIIVLDPPRAGIHQKVVDHLIHAHPASIVYVSCNPATQARDLALLKDHYQIVKMQPVDMFPQTHHVENVALLECTN